VEGHGHPERRIVITFVDPVTERQHLDVDATATVVLLVPLLPPSAVVVHSVART
jgi:hypothetical protein